MQFFRFLKWQWSKWIFWQKMFIASITVQLSSAFMPEPYDNIFRFTGIFVVFAFAFKWFVWDNAVKVGMTTNKNVMVFLTQSRNQTNDHA